MKITDFDFINETEDRCKNYSQVSSLSSKSIASSKAIISPAVIQERLSHVSKVVLEPVFDANERIINANDLMSINYLLIGTQVSKAVVRVHVKSNVGTPKGFGTGFMISPNLMMTNNHVFPIIDDTVNSLLEFDYQYNLEGVPSKSQFFRLQPNSFYYTNKELDFTIVAVSPITIDNKKILNQYGFLKLFSDSNKAIISEHVSIIQHPAGGFKQIALRENKINISDSNSPFLTYTTDTAQGSSGSPVFNDQWQVVALHHSGVPRKDSKGNILCKDGTIFRKGMDDSLIDWILNEGVRISAIIKDVKSVLPSNQFIIEMLQAPDKVLNNITPEMKPNPNDAVISNSTNSVVNGNKLLLNIPLEISVAFGNFNAPVFNINQDTISIPNSSNNTNQIDLPFIEKTSINDYIGRNGYDSNFVKKGTFKIELAKLLSKIKSNIAPLITPTSDSLLHYFNFSVAIHSTRKICMLTAVNIDGTSQLSITREDNPWIIDPRIDEKFQTGPAVYIDNDLDRGHMVRRLDPVWGKKAKEANDDTFHYSNSAPQHKNLNRKAWLRLEDYILTNAGAEGLKVSVFTGPIFGKDDRVYRGVQLPLAFWKVAAIIKKDGKPSITGYILQQPPELIDVKEAISDDGFGSFGTFQVPLSQIAKLTNINFDLFSKFDPLSKIKINESASSNLITNAEDIQF
jgi:endonuclease G, mitochondrial